MSFKLLVLVLVVVLAISAVAEAGILRKRNGERRGQVRKLFGGCGNGVCR